MAVFTSKASGDWSAGGQTTWNEVGVPTNGDTVVIAVGHTVTVDVNTTIGTSPAFESANLTGTINAATGSTAIAGTGTAFTTDYKIGDVFKPQTGSSRSIITAIASDIAMTVHRTVTVSAGINHRKAESAVTAIGTLNIAANLTLRGHLTIRGVVQVLAGGTLTFDGTQAGTPSTAVYSAWVGDGGVLHIGEATGNVATVTSDTTGGAAQGNILTDVGPGFASPATTTWQNATLTKLGAAATDAVNLSYSITGRSWTISGVVINGCGRLTVAGCHTGANLSFTRLACVNGLHTNQDILYSFTGTATGTRSLTFCRADKGIYWTGAVVPTGWVVEDVVTAWMGLFASSGSATVTSFQRLVVWGENEGMLQPPGGTTRDVLAIRNTATGNPHYVSLGGLTNTTHMIKRLVSQTLNASADGELFLFTTTNGFGTLTIEECLLLPGEAGLGSVAFTAGGGNAAPGTRTVNLLHNTAIVAGSQRAFAANGMQTSEGNIGMSGYFGVVRDNYVEHGGGAGNCFLVKDIAGNAAATITGGSGTTIAFSTRGGDAASGSNYAVAYTVRLTTQGTSTDPVGTEYVVTASTHSAGTQTYTIGAHGIAIDGSAVVRTFIKNLVAGGVSGIHHNAMLNLGSTGNSTNDETGENAQANTEGLTGGNLTGTYWGAGQANLTGEDPDFVERRDLPHWAEAILGLPANSWATSTSYAVGDRVKHAVAGKWGGTNVSFACTVAHTSGASTEPLSGASWRSNWEFTFMNEMKKVSNAATFDTRFTVDAAVDWLMAGWTPRNTALHAASDSVAPTNGWIGAVEGSSGGRRRRHKPRYRIGRCCR